jgi:hypothetical protein
MPCSGGFDCPAGRMCDRTAMPPTYGTADAALASDAPLDDAALGLGTADARDAAGQGQDDPTPHASLLQPRRHRDLARQPRLGARAVGTPVAVPELRWRRARAEPGGLAMYRQRPHGTAGLSTSGCRRAGTGVAWSVTRVVSIDDGYRFERDRLDH